MKNYKIFVLFLLLSISVFSKEQYIYSQITKENLIQTDQYIISGLDIADVVAVSSGGISLKDFLISDPVNDFETEFTPIPDQPEKTHPISC